MPLLCISLLALFLLPLTLSCDSRRSLQEVERQYSSIVQTDLGKARESIATLLQNSSCRDHKPHGCTSNSRDFVSTLLKLTCKMKKLRLPHTEKLESNVLNSIQCPCPETPTKDPNLRLRRRRTTRQKRNGQGRRKEKRKLCHAKAILSSMTECYQMLRSRH